MIKTNKGKIFDLFLKIRNKSSLLVVDEAHGFENIQRSYKFFAGKNCKIIGLTATPGRHGLTQMLKKRKI